MFDSPLKAHCGLTSANDIENTTQNLSFSPIPIHHLTPPPCSPARITSEDSIMKAFCSCDPEKKKAFLGEALSLFAEEQYGVDIPNKILLGFRIKQCGDFQMLAKAMLFIPFARVWVPLDQTSQTNRCFPL